MCVCVCVCVCLVDEPRTRLLSCMLSSGGSLCSGRRPAYHGGAKQRSRGVAPEYGGGREYDLEAEFMDELGPLPKDHAAQQVSGTAAYMQLIASFLPTPPG